MSTVEKSHELDDDEIEQCFWTSLARLFARTTMAMENLVHGKEVLYRLDTAQRDLIERAKHGHLPR
jgi:hypothetical protein